MAKACHFQEDTEGADELSKAFSEGASLRKHESHLDSASVLNKRSMVLDEETFEDAFLRCMVCRERFSEGDKQPKLFPCHHSFCLRCILQLFRTESDYRQSAASTLRGFSTSVSLHCPTCRNAFITSEEHLVHLPTDHRIVQLMDFVRVTDRYTVNFCSKHTLQPLNFFCEPCIKPVCRDCTVLDHQEKEGHLVMDLEDALKKYTPVLDKAIQEMDTEAVALEEKRIALDAIAINGEKMKSDLNTQIHGAFARLHSLLSEREKELESMADATMEKEKTRLEEKAASLKERFQMLRTQSKKLQQAKEDGNVEQMFRIHQDMRDYRTGQNFRVREVDDGIMSTFSFNARDESIISTRIKNFGDISSHVETRGRVHTYRSSSLPSSHR